ncbi:MAG: hypothetical protein KGH75_00985 [Rhodospirillales bacterium]|nr:hypothetical protein [Rhodospirillales bacterium]
MSEHMAARQLEAVCAGLRAAVKSFRRLASVEAAKGDESAREWLTVIDAFLQGADEEFAKHEGAKDR